MSTLIIIVGELILFLVKLIITLICLPLLAIGTCNIFRWPEHFSLCAKYADDGLYQFWAYCGSSFVTFLADFLTLFPAVCVTVSWRTVICWKKVADAMSSFHRAEISDKLWNSKARQYFWIEAAWLCTDIPTAIVGVSSLIAFYRIPALARELHRCCGLNEGWRSLVWMNFFWAMVDFGILFPLSILLLCSPPRIPLTIVCVLEAYRDECPTTTNGGREELVHTKWRGVLLASVFFSLRDLLGYAFLLLSLFPCVWLWPQIYEMSCSRRHVDTEVREENKKRIFWERYHDVLKRLFFASVLNLLSAALDVLYIPFLFGTLLSWRGPRLVMEFKENQQKREEGQRQTTLDIQSARQSGHLSRVSRTSTTQPSVVKVFQQQFIGMRSPAYKQTVNWVMDIPFAIMFIFTMVCLRGWTLYRRMKLTATCVNAPGNNYNGWYYCNYRKDIGYEAFKTLVLLLLLPLLLVLLLFGYRIPYVVKEIKEFIELRKRRTQGDTRHHNNNTPKLQENQLPQGKGTQESVCETYQARVEEETRDVDDKELGQREYSEWTAGSPNCERDEGDRFVTVVSAAEGAHDEQSAGVSEPVTAEVTDPGDKKQRHMTEEYPREAYMDQQASDASFIGILKIIATHAALAFVDVPFLMMGFVVSLWWFRLRRFFNDFTVIPKNCVSNLGTHRRGVVFKHFCLMFVDIFSLLLSPLLLLSPPRIVVASRKLYALTSPPPDPIPRLLILEAHPVFVHGEGWFLHVKGRRPTGYHIRNAAITFEGEEFWREFSSEMGWILAKVALSMMPYSLNSHVLNLDELNCPLPKGTEGNVEDRTTFQTTVKMKAKIKRRTIIKKMKLLRDDVPVSIHLLGNDRSETLFHLTTSPKDLLDAEETGAPLPLTGLRSCPFFAEGGERERVGLIQAAGLAHEKEKTAEIPEGVETTVKGEHPDDFGPYLCDYYFSVVLRQIGETFMDLLAVVLFVVAHVVPFRAWKMWRCLLSSLRATAAAKTLEYLREHKKRYEAACITSRRRGRAELSAATVVWNRSHLKLVQEYELSLSSLHKDNSSRIYVETLGPSLREYLKDVELRINHLERIWRNAPNDLSDVGNNVQDLLRMQTQNILKMCQQRSLQVFAVRARFVDLCTSTSSPPSAPQQHSSDEATLLKMYRDAYFARRLVRVRPDSATDQFYSDNWTAAGHVHVKVKSMFSNLLSRFHCSPDSPATEFALQNVLETEPSSIDIPSSSSRMVKETTVNSSAVSRALGGVLHLPEPEEREETDEECRPASCHQGSNTPQQEDIFDQVQEKLMDELGNRQHLLEESRTCCVQLDRTWAAVRSEIYYHAMMVFMDIFALIGVCLIFATVYRAYTMASYMSRYRHWRRKILLVFGEIVIDIIFLFFFLILMITLVRSLDTVVELVEAIVRYRTYDSCRYVIFKNLVELWRHLKSILVSLLSMRALKYILAVALCGLITPAELLLGFTSKEGEERCCCGCPRWLFVLLLTLVYYAFPFILVYGVAGTSAYEPLLFSFGALVALALLTITMLLLQHPQVAQEDTIQTVPLRNVPMSTNLAFSVVLLLWEAYQLCALPLIILLRHRSIEQVIGDEAEWKWFEEAVQSGFLAFSGTMSSSFDYPVGYWLALAVVIFYFLVVSLPLVVNGILESKRNIHDAAIWQAVTFVCGPVLAMFVTFNLVSFTICAQSTVPIRGSEQNATDTYGELGSSLASNSEEHVSYKDGLIVGRYGTSNPGLCWYEQDETLKYGVLAFICIVFYVPTVALKVVRWPDVTLSVLRSVRFHELHGALLVIVHLVLGSLSGFMYQRPTGYAIVEFLLLSAFLGCTLRNQNAILPIHMNCTVWQFNAWKNAVHLCAILTCVLVVVLDNISPQETEGGLIWVCLCAAVILLTIVRILVCSTTYSRSTLDVESNETATAEALISDVRGFVNLVDQQNGLIVWTPGEMATLGKLAKVTSASDMVTLILYVEEHVSMESYTWMFLRTRATWVLSLERLRPSPMNQETLDRFEEKIMGLRNGVRFGK